MDIAVLSDIHGNYVALKKCVEYALNKGIYTFIFLGDYVAEFPYPQKTMKMLYDMRERYRCYFVRGNKEDYWIQRREDANCEWKTENRTLGALQYCYANLTDKDIDFFKYLPIYQTIEIKGVSGLMICHGSPLRNKQKMLPEDEETEKVMEACENRYILFGHTHKQGSIEYAGKVAWNPGSVGVPIQSGGKAQFMILHQKEDEWVPEFLSLDYVKESIMLEMIESGLEKMAPYWTLITRHLLHTGEISHEFVLKNACKLCETETGTGNWYDVPDKYWIKVITKYLPIREMDLGKSGAKVSELIDHRIMKVVFRDELNSEILWEKYKKEALFYDWCMKSKSRVETEADEIITSKESSSIRKEKGAFLPHIYVNIHTEDVIFMIMEQYIPLQKEQLSEEQLGKIMEVLVNIHHVKCPDFLSKEKCQPAFVKEEDIMECMTGWQSVLREHPNMFDIEPLREICENINEWNRILFDGNSCFNHGDFHFDNLLADTSGNIVVVDWQNCGLGNRAGDIAFLLSRLSADGFALEVDKILELYCKSAEKNGIRISTKEIQQQMCLANLNTSFLFWHVYLHGSTKKRVGDIYEKMVKDAKVVRNAIYEKVTDA